MTKRTPKSTEPSTSVEVAKALPQPNPGTRKSIVAARKRMRERAAAPRVSAVMRDGAMQISTNHTDLAGWTDHLRDAFGTRSVDFAAEQLNAVSKALSSKNPITEPEINGALAMIAGMKAANEMEAALSVQITASHILSMRMLGKAANAEFLPQLDSFINAATKLQRTMTAQIDTLASLRRGGKQQVIVKHVHVHQGDNGQAVIGDVHHTPGTRGQIENESQPYGTNDIGALTLAHGEAVRCEETEWQPVSVAGRKR